MALGGKHEDDQMYLQFGSRYQYQVLLYTVQPRANQISHWNGSKCQHIDEPVIKTLLEGKTVLQINFSQTAFKCSHID